MNTTQTTVPAERCTICLVRHGETAWNAERRLQGHIDIPLNNVGLAQAEAVADRLQRLGQRFSAVYCSDLQRARQTAAAVMRTQELDALNDKRLRERHYGLFQGLTYAEAERQHPELYHRFKQREPALEFPQQGESLIDFAARVRAALQDIAHRHAHEQVLVVTHSPQVAARGAYQWRVSKSLEGEGARTSVHVLDALERKEEIARMLAGAKVTDEARAAADSLLNTVES